MSYGSELEDTRECEAMRKMFVGGLNRETADDTFFNYFGEYGTMVDQVVIKDPMTKKSRGFGFITYDQSSCVETVFQSRPHELDGKTLDVKRAMPREFNTAAAHSKVTTLFVGGVAPDLQPEELQAYIENRHPPSIGTVDKIDILKDKETNNNKGFGFLECSSTDFADRLTISENAFVLNGKKMSLKKAEPKGGEGGGGGRGRGGRGGMRGGRGSGRGGRGGPRGGHGGGGGGGYGWNGNDNYNGYQQQQQQGGYNNYSTGYPSYAGNPGAYGGYVQQPPQQQQPAQQAGYGAYSQNGYENQGAYGGATRYQPY